MCLAASLICEFLTPLLQDAQFDARLFNQSAGMSSGFEAEDAYNVYSKPLFDRGEATSVYRPKRDDSEM